MHRKDRPDSRWDSTPRNTPHHPDTHPVEREQELRHKRRHRLSGEPSQLLSMLSGPRPLRALDRLRGLYATLERDHDSPEAWADLSKAFADLADAKRSVLCEDIARNLRRAPAA